ncbi:MAG: peptide deformylase [Chloroflexi bacterium]|nr:peptide deformylase [Chloroflexota bacterium]
MAILPVRHLPEPVLRERTRRVTAIGPSIRRLIEDMIDTMHDQHGVGIAANQVGSLLRLAVIEVPRRDEEEGEEAPQETQRYILVNPEIVRRVGERVVEEGCLSLPGLRGRLTRSLRVTARALDLEGAEYRIRAEGLLAEALEHETDHLNGIAYIDRIEKMEDLWSLVPAGEEGDRGAGAGPDPETAWGMRRAAPPVVRRG